MNIYSMCNRIYMWTYTCTYTHVYIYYMCTLIDYENMCAYILCIYVHRYIPCMYIHIYNFILKDKNAFVSLSVPKMNWVPKYWVIKLASAIVGWHTQISLAVHEDTSKLHEEVVQMVYSRCIPSEV